MESSLSSEGSDLPQQTFLLLFQSTMTGDFTPFLIIGVIVLLLLILLSSLFSASENAFFSLSSSDLYELEKRNPIATEKIRFILSKPRRLLATILFGNNLVNVAFIILSSLILNIYIDFTQFPEWVDFLVKVLLVTFILLIFGEVIPKTYATTYNKQVAAFLVSPLRNFQRLFSFVIYPLSNSVALFEKKVIKKQDKISADQLSHAIDITTEMDNDEAEMSILKGIVRFGNTEVRQIMKPRIDVIGVDIDLDFDELIEIIKSNGYSRMPVYQESLDQIEGIIYIKDVLPFLDRDKSFNWRKLIKPPFFVPENKKIDDLLKEFQEKRVHMAIVADEFGGKQGIITLEDILEEIFGEINDEFDVAESQYILNDDNSFNMDSKIPLKDFYKIAEIDENIFQEIGDEVETLGGLVMELSGKIPPRGFTLKYENLRFTVEAVDRRRIKRIKVEKFEEDTFDK